MKQVWNKQQGMSLWGVLAGVFGALFVFWIAIKVVPEYMEADTIQKCLEDARAGGGSNINFASVQQRFDACLTTNSIYEGVKAKDIALRGTTVTLSWKKQIPITGNASLLLEFEAQAPK
ncbi:MAG: DUF4845 domain-containing protein [Proteobacteria bacterium]|nr:DUF4845 domain-containing protein [Pseudomonadota bacterium]MCL2306978.1 DUF4845 domain-containing protein [Pseudomonadota bacterium]